jgi:hypothetical protein
MIQRCTNSKLPKFKNYGGRGITVCERWLSFANFLADMGECPPGLTIERDDVNGNYEPGNCRWADMATQQRNRRNNVLITCNGETMTMMEWQRKTGVHRHMIKRRLDAGQSPEEILKPK